MLVSLVKTMLFKKENVSLSVRQQKRHGEVTSLPGLLVVGIVVGFVVGFVVGSVVGFDVGFVVGNVVGFVVSFVVAFIVGSVVASVVGTVVLYPSTFQLARNPLFVDEESERKSIHREEPLDVITAGLLLPQYVPIRVLLEDPPSLMRT